MKKHDKIASLALCFCFTSSNLLLSKEVFAGYQITDPAKNIVLSVSAENVEQRSAAVQSQVDNKNAALELSIKNVISPITQNAPAPSIPQVNSSSSVFTLGGAIT